jgi:hypothetical protein
MKTPMISPRIVSSLPIFVRILAARREGRKAAPRQRRAFRQANFSDRFSTSAASFRADFANQSGNGRERRPQKGKRRCDARRPVLSNGTMNMRPSSTPRAYSQSDQTIVDARPRRMESIPAPRNAKRFFRHPSFREFADREALSFGHS